MPQYAYFIVSGLLRFYYVDINGKQVNKSFLRRRGAWFIGLDD